MTLVETLRASALLVPGLLLASCAVGPDFERPAAPQAGFAREPLPAATAAADVQAGEAQTFKTGAAISADWWTLFQSPALTALIDRGLKNSPTLEQARAALRQAQETLYAQEGAYFPSVDGNVSVTRQKSVNTFGSFAAPGTSFPAFTVATAAVSVSYPLDIFGGTRRRVESAAAQAERARFEAEAATLALTANVVTAAVQQASLRAQIAATQAIYNIQNEQLGVLRQQLSLGAIAEADVLTQEAAVAQTRALLPNLQRLLAQSRNQLLALVGGFPSEQAAEDFDLTTLALPQEIPVSLPSEVVNQRPDIRAAEASLHAASAQVGVATANTLPQITLSASYGTGATRVEDLFSPGTAIWSLGAGLVQPLFHGGTLVHQRRAAVAAFDAAAAQYRGTVVIAFQNVADVLQALQSDADAVAAEAIAERSAKNSLSIAENRYRTGATNFVTLLDAQRTYQQARIGLVQAQASRLADSAALFAALGGGWWNRAATLADAGATAK